MEGFQIGIFLYAVSSSNCYYPLEIDSEYSIWVGVLRNNTITNSTSSTNVLTVPTIQVSIKIIYAT